MSELIDKQAVLKVIREMPYIGLGEKEALLDAIKGMPTEVVIHCEDCKFYLSNNGGSCMRSGGLEYLITADEYCSKGERKETR